MPTLRFARKPNTGKGFNLSSVRTVLHHFAMSRGLSADSDSGRLKASTPLVSRTLTCRSRAPSWRGRYRSERVICGRLVPARRQAETARGGNGFDIDDLASRTFRPPGVPTSRLTAPQTIAATERVASCSCSLSCCWPWARRRRSRRCTACRRPGVQRRTSLVPLNRVIGPRDCPFRLRRVNAHRTRSRGKVATESEIATCRWGRPNPPRQARITTTVPDISQSVGDSQ